MKKLFYRIVTGLLLAGWMCIIFRFSAQPAVESEQVSGSVSYRMVEVYCEMFHKELTQSRMDALAGAIDYPIRKAAHMTEYAANFGFPFWQDICRKMQKPTSQRFLQRHFMQHRMRFTSFLCRGARENLPTSALIPWARCSVCSPFSFCKNCGKGLRKEEAYITIKAY